MKQQSYAAGLGYMEIAPLKEPAKTVGFYSMKNIFIGIIQSFIFTIHTTKSF